MKKKKLKKSTIRKLLKTWPGICILIAFFGYQYYIDQKPIEPGERYEVSLVKCVDGDTAWFMVEGEETKVRFLYIDTPESTNTIEPYGKEASAYVEEELNKANQIYLETNLDGDQYDKYGRLLAWVFVDDRLLQEEIAKNGYVKKYYDYGYLYTYKDDIIRANEEAQKNKVGMYEE